MRPIEEEDGSAEEEDRVSEINIVYVMAIREA
jgi:hypothetical protein